MPDVDVETVDEERDAPELETGGPRLVDVPSEDILGGLGGAVGQATVPTSVDVGDTATNTLAATMLGIAFFSTSSKETTLRVLFGISGGIMAVKALLGIGRITGIIKK